jgi:hypothetical protein
LPLEPEDAATRRQALATLKAMLQAPVLFHRKDRDSWMLSVLEVLTSKEIISLLNWEDLAKKPSSSPWYEGSKPRMTRKDSQIRFVQAWWTPVY